MMVRITSFGSRTISVIGRAAPHGLTAERKEYELAQNSLVARHCVRSFGPRSTAAAYRQHREHRGEGGRHRRCPQVLLRRGGDGGGFRDEGSHSGRRSGLLQGQRPPVRGGVADAEGRQRRPSHPDRLRNRTMPGSFATTWRRKASRFPRRIDKDANGNRSFVVKDPDGHSVQFVQYMPGSIHSRNFGKHLSASAHLGPHAARWRTRGGPGEGGCLL